MYFEEIRVIYLIIGIVMVINGLMKVKSLQSDFKKEFGLTLRVYDGRSFADSEARLSSIRKNDVKKGEFSPRNNTKVGSFEDKLMSLFGIKAQVSGSDDSYLCDNDLTLSSALKLDIEKMERKKARENKKLDSAELNEVSNSSAESKITAVSDIKKESDGLVRFTLLLNLEQQYLNEHIPNALELEGFDDFDDLDEDDKEMIEPSAKYELMSEYVLEDVVGNLFDLYLVGDLVSVHTGYGDAMYPFKNHDDIQDGIPSSFWDQLNPCLVPLNVVMSGMTKINDENIEAAELTSGFTKMSRQVEFDLIMKNSKDNIVMQHYLDGDISEGFFKDPKAFSLDGERFNHKDKISEKFLLNLD
jgi:hypothetical protein